MYRCDRRCDGCDGKFGNLAETKHTLRLFELRGMIDGSSIPGLRREVGSDRTPLRVLYFF